MGTALGSHIFESARLKLTLFYLAIILALSLTLSFGTRWLAEHEYQRSNVAQRGAIEGVITRTLGIQRFEGGGRAGFYDFQEEQEEYLRNKLNQYVLMINLGALVVGSLASYLFAGWTLRPIEEAHEAQKRFASDASHELRTPLAAMKLENEVFLRQKTFKSDEARELIQSNLEEVDRLERLATSLLTLAQYDQRDVVLKRMQLKTVLSSAITHTKKVHPKVVVNENIQKQFVMGDKDSLRQLFVILLDNAVKYGSRDKPIDVSCEALEDQVKVHIRDYGQGISDDDLPYIFDRLYRGDASRSSAVAGHGLGLSIAKRIAAVNQADLSVQNAEDGNGAVFTISFAVS